MNLIRVSLKKWQSHDASLRAAAITFFSILPLPSLALITLAILAQFFGQELALQQIITQIRNIAGPSIADLFSQILANAENPLTSFFGSLIAIVFTLGGAIGAFSALVKSVNAVWEIDRARLRFKENIKEKMEPFLLIGSAGFVVVVWTAFSTFLFDVVFVINPTGVFVPILLRIMQVILSFGLGTLLFAIIFKYLPEIHVEWRDVVLAAVVTSFVFTLLNYIFGIYVALFPPTTIAGTAGSLMLLFLWIYLVNWFMLFGVQLSKIYAVTFGSHPTRTLREKKEEEQRMERVEKIEVKTRLEWKLSPDSQNK